MQVSNTRRELKATISNMLWNHFTGYSTNPQPIRKTVGAQKAQAKMLELGLALVKEVIPEVAGKELTTGRISYIRMNPIIDSSVYFWIHCPELKIQYCVFCENEKLPFIDTAMVYNQGLVTYPEQQIEEPHVCFPEFGNTTVIPNYCSARGKSLA